jgi:hypothetical protein
MQPTIGRIVHYMSYGTPGGEHKSECRAAVVTEVGTAFAPLPPIPGDGTPVTATLTTSPEPVVGLCVMNPTGLFLNRDVRQDEDSKAGGTWHWPERVPTSP